jgi:hypothetical protein
MSWYPSATKKPITGTSRVRVQKDLLCLHTAVGAGLSTWNYFNRTDVGVYSHGVICGVWGADAGQDVDGLALQMADTDYRAAANLDGNWRIISWETADNAARPIQPWTPAQCDTIVDVMVDAHRIDGIPLVLVPDSKPGRRGICYHRQGCDPYRVAGGELWSSAYGKDCPTDARIRQIPGLIARAVAIVNNPNSGGFMAGLTDAQQAKMAQQLAHLDAMFSENNTVGDINAIVTNEALQGTVLAGLAQGLQDTNTKLDQILAALAPKPV